MCAAGERVDEEILKRLFSDLDATAPITVSSITGAGAPSAQAVAIRYARAAYPALTQEIARLNAEREKWIADSQLSEKTDSSLHQLKLTITQLQSELQALKVQAHCPFSFCGEQMNAHLTAVLVMGEERARARAGRKALTQ
jgi:hypothetical protein